MVQKDRIWLFCLFILVAVVFTYPAFAEIRTFEKEVEEIVGRDQSQEQVEAFALQKAKRLAVEEAGTYISSLTVVQNFQLAKDEVTALASGVVQSQVLGVPSIVIKDGIVHVTVKAKITVDTAVLDQQIKEIMKESGTLKKLDDAQKKVRDLENKLANLKSSEIKRLEELNAQALTLERDRDRQRLAREEQVLKAQGEIKRAELDRLQKEREMQERISKTIAEQEKARREEAAALAQEQDRIRRAQLENEQRWNDLARKAQLTQSSWVPVNDSLSIKQAIEEARQIKQEIPNLNQRMESQYSINESNLKKAYSQQIALMSPKLPSKPAEKDAFETTAEYNKRLADYESAVKNAGKGNEAAIEKLRAEENLNLAKAKTDYLKQNIDILTPFVKRLASLQARNFLLPEGAALAITLGEPEADQNRFPISLEYKGQRWRVYWDYTDRNHARDFYKTRTYLKAEGLFQMEDGSGVIPRLTKAKVTHLGTKESREFALETPKRFTEIDRLDQLNQDYALNKTKQQEAAELLKAGISSKTFRCPATGMEFIFVFEGCFKMGDTFGDGGSDERPVHEVCLSPYFIGKYEVTQGQWQAIMGNNPSNFTNCGKNCPVENVSWNDAQAFINKLNEREGTDKYRLPTEAEWEYAARSGGKSEKYSGGDDVDSVAWYSSNSGSRTHPVGQKEPNGLGIYDMSGNVWEWVDDIYSSSGYSSHGRNNPIYTGSGSGRVNRGGSWNFAARDVRAANRDYNTPDDRVRDLGFRLARTR